MFIEEQPLVKWHFPFSLLKQRSVDQHWHKKCVYIWHPVRLIQCSHCPGRCHNRLYEAKTFLLLQPHCIDFLPQSLVPILALLTSSPWNIEFLSTAEPTQNSSQCCLTGHMSVLNKRHWCQKSNREGCFVPQKTLVMQTVGDNFLCKSHCTVGTAKHCLIACRCQLQSCSTTFQV